MNAVPGMSPRINAIYLTLTIKQKKLGKKFGVLICIVAVILQVALAYNSNAGMVSGHTLRWCVIARGMYVAFAFHKVCDAMIELFMIHIEKSKR